MEIGCACVREPQNGECLGTAQVNGYLAFHVNAHGATELILKKRKEKYAVIPNVSRLLPVSLEGSLPLTVHLSWGLQISRCACSSVSTPSQCCLLCSVAAWHPQPGSPWGLCPHCESNPKSKSKHLHREWESWVLMHCRGVCTHLPETVWNHEMPGKARAG